MIKTLIHNLVIFKEKIFQNVLFYLKFISFESKFFVNSDLSNFRNSQPYRENTNQISFLSLFFSRNDYYIKMWIFTKF